MNETFACPECGARVEVRGLAPGRQVRCGFCRRLLEVPYMPRVADPRWKRKRFERPGWVPWAWAGCGAVAVAIVALSLVRLVGRYQRDWHERSIARLVADAEREEEAGELARALVDLETALHLQAGSDDADPGRLEQLRAKRRDLARKDARAAAERLSRERGGTFPIQGWLNLQGRAQADPDLEPLRQPIAEQLAREAGSYVAARAQDAEGLLGAGRAAEALERLEAGAALLKYVPDADRPRLQGRLDQEADGLVRSHGIGIDRPAGRLLPGSEGRHQATLLPMLRKAVAAKGYVPRPEASPWSALWDRAPYRLAVEIREAFEGGYLGSENRLTRIEARLALLAHGREVWQTTPAARTTVPLPRLPAYVSTRLALSPKRIDEFERLLYDNARDQIAEKLSFALAHLPECGRDAAEGAP